MASSLFRHVFKSQRSIIRYKNLINNELKYNRNFSISSYVLAERLFTEKHEWVQVDGSVATIGISDYAQEQLGDIVYAQPPEAGIELDKDDECGALESVKAASELYTPVSGTVIEGNQVIVDKPAIINTSPYDEGWLYKLELSKKEELDNLMSEESYNTFVQDQN